MAATHRINSSLTERLAHLCIDLKPFQSLEYNPDTGGIQIVTERLVPAHSPGQMVRIVASAEEGEKVEVKRFPDAFKITVTTMLVS